MSETSAVDLDFDFASLPEIGNGFLTRLDAIREADPVFWSDIQNGWFITRNADVMAGFQGEYPLANARIGAAALSAIPQQEQQATVPMLHRFVPMMINNTDAPVHTRMRKLVVRAFNRKVVDGIRSFVQGNIEDILDDMATKDSVEFNSEVARSITARTLFRLLGLPDKYLPKLKEWAPNIVIALGAVNASREQLMAAEQSFKEIYDLVVEVVEERRKHPTDDVITRMVQAVDEGDRLTLDEMVGVCNVLLLAGHDTTLNSMSLYVEALSHRPDLREQLRNDPEIGEAASIELSRTTAMSVLETRLVTEDFEWHGKQLKKGSIVFLIIAAGNRDPRAFDNPLEIDFSRNTDLVLTWGPGLHHCIGHMLAKMQLAEFMTRAYRRFENIEVVEPDLRFAPSPGFRGFSQMHVRAVPLAQPLPKLPI